MRSSSPVRAFVALATFALALVVTLAFTRTASAYPWMIRHGYGACTTCHLDPSGAGVLTPYGRAQGDLLLRDHYTKNGKAGPEEASKTAGFLFGLLETPDWLLPGGSYRGMYLYSKPPSPAPAIARYVQMQADLKIGLQPGIFRAGASLGYAHGGALSASITSRDKDNLVSREHWIGVAIGDAVMIRTGRLALPFGVRTVEHNAFVRASTRTDLNDTQQYGLALAYSDTKSRGELMAIVGNFALHPDDYRERGYSALFEYFVDPHVGIGLSSLRTQALRDVTTRVAYARQAHGLFVRASPWEPLVLMAEGDWLLLSPDGAATASGYAGLLQADFEVRQGMHVMVTGETLRPAQAGADPSFGAWLSLTWFFAPHFDVRTDFIHSRVAAGGAHANVESVLLQLHAFL